jgi:8-oxo-dGTP diphosphatase
VTGTAVAPRPGVGVLLLRDGKILLGRRRGSHGAGDWAPPGGHVDEGESAEATARREVLEETGLVIERTRVGPVTEDRFPEGKHYLTTFVAADAPAGEPQNLEPTKCEGGAWFDWDGLPAPLFLPLLSLHRSGFRPT